MELAHHGAWGDDGAPHADVVMSCRARLARNIAGFPFVNRASETQQQELVNIGRSVLLGASLADGMFWVDLFAATEQDRQLLVERHLISKQHAEADNRRGVAISGDERLSVMVNEEDHLRMQILAPGLQLRELYRRIDAIDDEIESRIDYAFSQRWGYMTACPTNVGTGVRFSVMVHLPGLKITKQIDRVRHAARELHLAVRGFYGEGSDSAGDFYQISNQVTLGRSEEEILAGFDERILPRIIDYEQQARSELVRRNPTALDDRSHRALGVLRNARLLGLEETMRLLSHVRLGIETRRLPEVSAATVNRLFLMVQPAHLRQHLGQDLEGQKIRIARANLVRGALGGA